MAMRAVAGRGDGDDYDASKIAVLEGLAPVRKRPGMYIGSTGPSGLHHLIWEVVDNSVDEAMAGYADRIDVTLLADGGCRVVDNGRGFPVDPHPQYPDKSGAEVALTMLHAGGKFGGGGYKVSGGLHGVGVSVVNALSRRMTVEVDRKGEHYMIEFGDGGVLKQKLARTGPTPRSSRRLTSRLGPSSSASSSMRSSTRGSRSGSRTSAPATATARPSSTKAGSSIS